MITEIEFKRTSNIFINAGIVALTHYLELGKKETGKYQFEYEYELRPEKLILKSPKLIPLLNLIYNNAGNYKEDALYETITEKQIKEKNKFYFVEEPFEGRPFAKIKTYGFGALITKNPPVIAGEGGRKIKFEKLYQENPVFAIKVADFLYSNGKKLKFFDFKEGRIVENEILKNGQRKENAGGESEIFINAGYTTIPKLNIEEKYLKKGNRFCPILNEGFEKLYENKCASPFYSGNSNFNSYFDSDGFLSLKAVYLMRLSPKVCYYTYRKQNPKDKEGKGIIYCNLYHSDNLIHQYSLFDSASFQDKDFLTHNYYKSNLRLFPLKYPKKDKDDFVLETNEDCDWQSEISFMLLYTFYKRKLELEFVTMEEEDIPDDPFGRSEYDNVPISIVSFRAERFGDAMRPNEYEEYSNAKYIIQLIHLLEHNKILKTNIRTVWQDFKFKTTQTESIKDYDKKHKIERQLRGQIFSKFLKCKSIISEVEWFFYQCFNLLLSENEKQLVLLKNYNFLFNFLIIYEKQIPMNQQISEQLQSECINLGRKIGKSITENGVGSNIDKVKRSRKYTIRLRKARTHQQFVDVFFDLINKYQIGFIKDNDFLKQINEKNYSLVKQYLLISLLNELNTNLSKN